MMIKKKIGQLGEVVGGATPNTKDPALWGGDIAWITPKDLAGFRGRFIASGQRGLTREGFESCSATLLPQGSVLFSSRAPIGYVSIAAGSLCTNQGFKSIVPNGSIDSLFLYYLMRHMSDAIAARGSGTTFKEVSGKTLSDFEVEIPNAIEEQRVIAGILDSLDSKIELNSRINDHLEELLDSIFEHALANCTEWNEASLLDIADYKNGLAMQKFRPEGNDPGLPVLKIRELNQGYCGSDAERCRSNIDEDVKIRDGDLVFSWSGTLLLDFWTGGNAGLNQHLFKVTSSSFPKWFYYMWTKRHMRKFVSLARDRATTMGHIKRSALAESMVLIPPKSDMRRLTALCQPILDQKLCQRIENRSLERVRDTLLPKLMSGEIDVSRIDLKRLNGHLSADSNVF